MIFLILKKNHGVKDIMYLHTIYGKFLLQKSAMGIVEGERKQFSGSDFYLRFVFYSNNSYTLYLCTMYIELDICGYPIALQKKVAKSVVMRDHY